MGRDSGWGRFRRASGFGGEVFWGGFRGFGGEDFGLSWGASGFRGEGFGLSWVGFGLSWEKLRAFAGRDSGFRGASGFRGDLGFRGGLELWWGGIRASETILRI